VSNSYAKLFDIIKSKLKENNIIGTVRLIRQHKGYHPGITVERLETFVKQNRENGWDIEHITGEIIQQYFKE
jgi:hypothetical protein